MTPKSRTIFRGAGTLVVCALTLTMFAQTLTPGIEKSTSPLPDGKPRTQYMECADSAFQMIEEEKWESAAVILERTLRENPGNPLNALLLSNLGIARTHLGDIDGALEAYDIAEAINGKESRIPENRAYTLLTVGRNSDALDALNASLAIDSIRKWPLKMRGLILLSKGDMEGAFKDLSRFTQHYESDADVWNGLASCHEFFSDIDAAIDCYKKSIELVDDPVMRADMSLAMAKTGKIDEANLNISEGLTRWPESGELYLVRAYIEKLTFQNRQSDVDRKHALKLGVDPELDKRLFGQHRSGRK